MYFPLGGYGRIFIILALGVIYGYVLFYLFECIRDSAIGAIRAPDTLSLDVPDKEDMALRMIYLLACVVICSLPVSIYYLFICKIDAIFWFLIACGFFFFPMSFLAVVIFDSASALKPMLILGSIFDTFLPYCGLVLTSCALIGIIALSRKIVINLRVWPPFSDVVFIYLAMIFAHLLGRFFCKNADRLNWEA